MTLTTDGTYESLAETVAAMEGRMAALSSEVASLRRENDGLRRSGRQKDEATATADGSKSLSRRGLLTVAAGAAGGVLVAGIASPAHAGNGDPVLLGDQTNSASDTTTITTSQGVGLIGDSTEVYSGSGPLPMGVVGAQSASTGGGYGVYGSSSAPSGMGCVGEALATSGTAHGVTGTSWSTTGIGVRGIAQASSGANIGVFGQAQSPAGVGVQGDSGATTGFTMGVKGSAASTSGTGVRGIAPAATGTTYGVWGSATSPNGFALYGGGRMKVTGRSYLGTPVGAPTDAHLSNGSISFYLDQAANRLKVRVKYSTGALKTGYISLA